VCLHNPFVILNEVKNPLGDNEARSEIALDVRRSAFGLGTALRSE